ncbi:MAG: hypothetical protein NWP79_02020, partial [Paracoccaceae bacterium]|nr:hypothetical protein [Paracoccaceae bacterium]
MAEEQAPQFAPISPRVPEPVAQETTPEITTAPVAPPQTAQVDTALDLPADTAEPELAPRADATIAGAVPQAPSTLDVQNAAPQAPLLDAGIADAPVPLVIEAAPEAENETQTTAAATPEETQAPLIVITEAAPEPSPIETPTDSESLAVADVPAQTQAAPAAPPVAETPAPAPLIAEVAQMPEVFTPEPAPVVTETVQDAGAEPATQPGPAVRINRPGAVPAAPLDDAAEAVDADTVPADAPALLRFAAPFENPENLPLISVILLDEGAMSDMAQAIAALPFSPTIVVDALAENAGSRAAIYRAAAAEVAVQLSLPAG